MARERFDYIDSGLRRIGVLQLSMYVAVTILTMGFTAALRPGWEFLTILAAIFALASLAYVPHGWRMILTERNASIEIDREEVRVHNEKGKLVLVNDRRNIRLAFRDTPRCEPLLSPNLLHLHRRQSELQALRKHKRSQPPLSALRSERPDPRRTGKDLYDLTPLRPDLKKRPL